MFFSSRNNTAQNQIDSVYHKIIKIKIEKIKFHQLESMMKIEYFL